MELPGKLTSLVSNAWESAKNAVGSFTVGITQGVNASGANLPAAQIAANAKGGIYSKGAFLTTFAEESPEAAIPIDNSERAKQLWLKTGQMLGLLQHSERNQGTATPSFTVQGVGPDVSPAQTLPEHHGQQLFIHGQMKTPGIFGMLQKWLQHPGTNEGKTVNLPVISKQPAPIVNTMAKLSGLAPMIGRAISVAALALSPMTAAASPAINPAILNAAANVMAAPPGVAVTSPAVTPIINATAAAPTVDIASPEAPIVNAMAAVPDVYVGQRTPNISPVINVIADRKAPAITLPPSPELPAPVLHSPALQVLHAALKSQADKKGPAARIATPWPTLQQPEPVGTITRMMQAAPPFPAGIVTPILPETFAPMADGNAADGSGTETGKPGLTNLLSALTSASRHAAAFQNTGVISQLPSMPALQSVGIVQPPELNQPADSPDLLRRIREFVQSPGDNISNSNLNITYAPTIAPNINITGDAGKQEVMEAIKQATDISYEKFQQMLKRYEHERRRTSYS